MIETVPVRDVHRFDEDAAGDAPVPGHGPENVLGQRGHGDRLRGDGAGLDIRAGAALSYTDNEDGKITDNNTGLMWEKKDDNNTYPLHDKSTAYTWADAGSISRG